MAKGMKSRGMAELQSLKRRTTRQHSLGRISRTDAEYLTDLWDKAEAKIINMKEEGESQPWF